MPHENLKHLVVAALGRHDFRAAEQLCDDAERDFPQAELSFIRGVVHSEQGNMEKAIAFLEQAFNKLPERGDVAYNYGVVLQKSGQMPLALEAWDKATHLAPRNIAAWLNLALGLTETKQFERALDVYARALIHHSTNRELLYNNANLFYRLGRLSESQKLYKKLLSFHIKDGPGWINYGMALKAAGQFTEAEACYRHALTLKAPPLTALAYFNLSSLLLHQERWQEGWAAYEWRLKLPGAICPPWNLPAWQNDLPKGSRVLLWNDQGLGDAFMFLRFAPLFEQRGYKLSLFVQDNIKSLMKTVPYFEDVFSPQDAPRHFDAALPLCSLPYVLNLPSFDMWDGAYLSAPKVENPLNDLSGAEPSQKLRIGLVWRGNPDHYNDENRSLNLEDVAPLFDVEGITWISLQVGSGADELRGSDYREKVTDLSPYLRDFATTAGVMEKMDLIISADTAPAHLAGAMGKPVWTLLPFLGGDWRWKSKGTTTSLYPTMKLFRQEEPKNWATPIAQVADALRNLNNAS